MNNNYFNVKYYSMFLIVTNEKYFFVKKHNITNIFFFII